MRHISALVRIRAKLAVWWPAGWCYLSMSALNGVWWVTNSLQVRLPCSVTDDSTGALWRVELLSPPVPVPDLYSDWDLQYVCSIAWIVCSVRRAQWTTAFVFFSLFFGRFPLFYENRISVYAVFTQFLRYLCLGAVGFSQHHYSFSAIIYARKASLY